jgi:hypothetical protein
MTHALRKSQILADTLASIQDTYRHTGIVQLRANQPQIMLFYHRSSHTVQRPVIATNHHTAQ